jgi:heme A synthase
MSWFPLFLDLFALGTLASLAFVPFREIGSYYFRFHALVAALMAALGTTIGEPWAELGRGPAMHRMVAAGALGFGVLVLLFYAVTRKAEKDLRIDAILLPVTVGASWIAMWAFERIEYGTFDAALLAVHLLTSAAVLGTSLVAMSTGHWYLANAALSFDILIRLCRLFAGALVLKAVVSAIYLWKGRRGFEDLEAFYLLVIGVRLVAGLLLAGLLAWMSLSCAKRKANQSATGILYVAVVFVLMGEVISLYLSLRGPKNTWLPV